MLVSRDMARPTGPDRYEFLFQNAVSQRFFTHHLSAHD
jgi:hypothetical protein